MLIFMPTFLASPRCSNLIHIEDENTTATQMVDLTIIRWYAFCTLHCGCCDEATGLYTVFAPDMCSCHTHVSCAVCGVQELSIAEGREFS
jgi:hypothetical protein